MSVDRPPLGLMPRGIWRKNRKVELINAIGRYLDSDMQIPQEWIDEFSELNKEPTVFRDKQAR